MEASDVAARVLDALAPVAEQLPEVRWRDAAADDRLTVRSAHAAPACPAAMALDGDPGFAPRPAVVAPAATGAVLDRLVLGDRDPTRRGGATDPATAFREVLADPPEHWAWEWAVGAGREERALLAAAVSRRVAGVARMLEPWPPPDATHAGRRAPWIHPDRPLRLTGSIDATLGRRDGTHTIVVLLSGDHAAGTRQRLAYEAVLEVLNRRRPPAVVRGLLPDAGRQWSLPVDDDLLDLGAAAVGLAARTALGVRRADAGGLARRPSTACRRCPHVDGCAEGRVWLGGPGRLRLGFLPPVPA
jgi:hypothetical protein